MKVRNVSGGDLDVRAPGFERLVGDGETVDVPEFQPDGESPVEWDQPGRWEIIPEAQVKPEKATADKADV